MGYVYEIVNLSDRTLGAHFRVFKRCSSLIRKMDTANNGQNNVDKKPVCKYGGNCYRKNQGHLDKYKHPAKRQQPVSVCFCHIWTTRVKQTSTDV